MKKNIVFFVLISLGLIPLFYLFFNSIKFISSIEDVREPNYFHELFIKSDKLLHVSSETQNKSNVISVYNYNNFQQGVVVLRKKTTEDSIEDLITIEDKAAFRSSDAFRGSIFNENLYYLFSQDQEVNNITITGINLDSRMFYEKTEKSMYLKFDLSGDMSISFNNKEQVMFISKKLSNKKEINNVFIFLKEGYFYLIYAKPISFKNTDFNLLEIINKNEI